MKSLLRLVAVVSILAAMTEIAFSAPEKEVNMAEYMELIEAGISPPQILPDTKWRFAVFEFDDPAGTGLGKAASEIFQREILATASASKIGVIQFTESLAPTAESPVSYHDKVDLIVASQNVVLAVWGTVTPVDEGVRVDSYLLIPESSLEAGFTWRFRLPEATGGGELVARLRPNRLLLHSEVFEQYLDDEEDEEEDDVERVLRAAMELNWLRDEIDVNARKVKKLDDATIYYVHDKEEDDRGDEWLYLASSGASGWVPRQICDGWPCEELQEAANFSGKILQYVADPNRSAPDFGSAASLGAKALEAQLLFLDKLRENAEINKRDQIENWLNRTDHPPGGGAFSNLQALYDLVTKINMRMARNDVEFDDIELTNDELRPIIQELALASQDYPRNIEILQNLAVLFEQINDPARAELASRLAMDATN